MAVKAYLMKCFTYVLQINEAHFIIVPGNAFGSAGEGFVRLSFVSTEETIK